jgi:peroxiredoxin
MLAPRLVSLHRRHRTNNLEVVMVSRGDPEANRAEAREHDFPFPVLGYLLDERGVIAKDVAIGVEALPQLV